MLAENIHRLCIIPVPPAKYSRWRPVRRLDYAADSSTEEAALGARETASTMVSRWE
jgi:hypothetical protein